MTHAALKDLADELEALNFKQVDVGGIAVAVERSTISRFANRIRAAISAMEGEAVAWPNRMVNLPCPDGSTDRIVGFRVPEGDPILGKHGLSEPLAWLRKVTVERTAPPPQQED